VAVKAAFLSKFVAYVVWPATLQPAPNAAITLCILGSDPFGRIMDETVRGQQVDGHPLVVRRILESSDSGGCNLAFVQGRDSRGTAAMLAAMQGRPILTVTDARDGPPRGIIHFVIASGRVRFLVDQAAAKRNGLQLSARLLAIALEVSTGP
jgi:hypothetical protein